MKRKLCVKMIKIRRQSVKTGESLLAKYPKLAAQWHPTLNGDLKPEQFTAGSHKKVWWKCEKGHEWKAVISNRSSRGSSCPYCSGRKAIVGVNDLVTLNPAVAAQWHPTLNNGLLSEQFTAGSNKKVWWLCGKGHKWEAAIKDRSRRGSSCPYCSGRKAIVGVNDLVTLNPKLAAQWHPTKNLKLKPEQFSANSHKKVWWKCDKGHEWEAIIGHRSEGNGCPYCSGRKAIVGVNDLVTLSPKLSAQWHATLNGSLKPEDFTAGSNKKVWWLCGKGHKWMTTIYDRSHGSGCPKCSNCVSKTETRLYGTFLNADKNINFEHGKKIFVPWKRNKSASIDIYAEYKERKFVIEYDGDAVHDGRISGKGLEYHLNNDSLKTQALLDGGIIVFRLRANNLVHLDMKHKNLFQFSQAERGDFTERVNEIIKIIKSYV